MKERIRREIKQKREKLSKTILLKKSKQIKERLFDIDEFRDAQVVLFYVSYNNEVFTHDMIKETQVMGKQVVVPFSDTKNKTVIPVKLDSWDELKTGSYGILEPVREHLKKVTVDIVDVIIVPGVAFDICGRRIGHGLGYYDKLLAETDKTSIGLAFEIQIVESIPVERHDVSIDMIVTEKRTIKCLKN